MWLSACLAGGDEAEFGFGGDGVDDAEDEGAFAGVEGGEVGEFVAEGVFGGVQWPAWGGLDEEVVGGDVEDFGESHDGVC